MTAVGRVRTESSRRDQYLYTRPRLRERIPSDHRSEALTHPTIEMVPREKIKSSPRNARTHSGAQIDQIAQSLEEFGFLVPLVVNSNNVVVAGHGRLAGADKNGLKEIPVIRADHLSEARLRAFALADNRIAEEAGWDRKALALELPEIADLLVKEGLDISITGFSPVEIDQISTDFEKNSADPADEIDPKFISESSVTQQGDRWQLDSHYIACGDAQSDETLRRLVKNRRVAMAFLDPPYNVPIKKVVGRGSRKHQDFAMACGELSKEEFVAFLTRALKAAAVVSTDSAVHYVCMDWRHIAELIEAARAAYNAMLNLGVWVKSNAGQGSLYRSQHELVGVFRVGTDQHLNNVQLGRHGRNRSNVWHYAGANSFGRTRLADLESHPTVKPIALVADAMKDCTRREDLVLDSFSGSGTTLLAAERVGRRFVGLDVEPRFVDLAIRRWQAFTGKDAICTRSGRTFDETAQAAAKKAQRAG